MTKNANMSCILKYLAVACTRSNSDVGALVKALYHKYTEGKDESFADDGMQVLYLLFSNELDDLRMQKENQSKVNSENARSKKSASKSKTSKQKKVTDVADVTDDSAADDSDDGNDGDDTTSSDDDDAVVADESDPSCSEEKIKPPEVVSESSDRNIRNDNQRDESIVGEEAKEKLTPTFEQLRDVYNKTGDNESRARELWLQLSDEDKSKAFAYAKSIAGKPGYRSYLFVFLRDKEWLKKTAK